MRIVSKAILTIWLVLAACLIASPTQALSIAPVRFVFIADIQGSMPLVPPTVLSEHIANINSLNSDLVIIGGDLFAGYSSTAEILRKEWSVFNESIKSSIKAPVLPVIGNHDVSGAMALGVWQEEHLQYKPYYSHRTKDVLFINLNSEENYDKNSISQDQIRWLRDQLESASKIGTRAIIVSLHKPLWQYMNNWSTDVEPLLIKHKVNYVLAGHDHCYYLQNVKGINYVVAGGGGGWLEFQENPNLGSFYHFLEFNLDAMDKLSMLVVTLEGDKLNQDIITRDQQQYLLPLYRNCVKVVKRVSESGEQSLIFTFINPLDANVDIEIDFQNNPFWIDLNRKIEAKVDAKGIYESAVPLKPKNMLAQVNPPHCTIKLTTLYKSQPKSVFIYDAQ